MPHPALGFPTTLSLHYKSYSGWLSKGLPHWDIDKVVLTDSFGRSHSLCRPSTKLSSGSPVRMPLQAGNCELDNQDDYGAYTTTQPPASLSASTDAPVADSSVQESGLSASVDGVESVKQRKDIFNLGTSFKLAENQTYPLDQTDELPWQPILVGNSLDKDNNEAEAAESSRSLSDALAPGQQPADEIFEPVLKDRRLAVNRGRNLHELHANAGEIVEPVLKATTPRSKHGKGLQLAEPEDSNATASSTDSAVSPTSPASPAVATAPKMMAQLSSGSEEPQTVQLLPFRLGELLQRAERYARETLLPLISVQAPRFFGFNVTPHERAGESRKPRYIPRYEEAAFINKSSSQQRRSSESAEATDQASRRNLFRLLRSDAARGRAAQQPITSAATMASSETQQRDFNYYTNMLHSESRAMRPEAPEYRPVFIELPTYRPPVATTAKAVRRARVQLNP